VEFLKLAFKTVQKRGGNLRKFSHLEKQQYGFESLFRHVLNSELEEKAEVAKATVASSQQEFLAARSSVNSSNINKQGQEVQP